MVIFDIQKLQLLSKLYVEDLKRKFEQVLIEIWLNNLRTFPLYLGQGANIDLKKISMLEMLHQGTFCRQNIFDSVSNELSIDWR
jgi:hypothetical protein